MTIKRINIGNSDKSKILIKLENRVNSSRRNNYKDTVAEMYHRGTQEQFNDDGERLREVFCPSFEPWLSKNKPEVSIKKFLETVSGLQQYTPSINDFYCSIEQNRLFIFNIQFGSRSDWKHLQEMVLSADSLKNVFFLFYWKSLKENNTSAARQKKENEKSDLQWSKSRFLRDYLKYHGKASEIDLAELVEKGSFDPNSIKEGFDKEFSIRSSFDGVSEKIFNSLKTVYGENWNFHITPRDINFFFLYNRSKHSASDKLLLKTIQDAVTINGVTGKAGDHGMLGVIDKNLQKFRNDKNYFSEFGSNSFWLHFIRTVSSLTSMYFEDRQKPSSLVCLFVDDKIDTIKKKVLDIKEWFPEALLYYIEDPRPINNWSDENFEVKTFNREKKSIHVLDEVDFIFVDLEFEGDEFGFTTLHRLRGALHGKTKPFIITLSRKNDPESIQRSLNSGALFHITKDYFHTILPILAQFSGEKYKNIPSKKYAAYENWHLLSKLPLSKILELQSTVFAEIDASNYFEKDSAQYRWVQKLPKADLHCHIGSSMSTDMLPVTALLVITEKMKYEQVQGKLDAYKTQLQHAFEFLFPIAFDPYILERKLKLEQKLKTSPYPDPAEHYKKTLSVKEGNLNRSILQIIKEDYITKGEKRLPEVILFDPANLFLENRYHSLDRAAGDPPEFFARRGKLRGTISYDELILLFEMLLYLRENAELNFDKLWLRCRNENDGNIAAVDLLHPFVEMLNVLLKPFNEDTQYARAPGQSGILKFLRSARSEQRCLQKDGESLFDYLRGCEYAGAAHMQTKAAMWRVVRSIIEDYAIPDNIRYLCLRCSVNGYSKMKLISDEDAVKCLLEALYFYMKKAFEDGHPVRVNVIVTAKRHKSEHEMRKNVELALKYRTGLSKEKDLTVNPFLMKPKVVSFDLAGLEKGFPPSKFKNILQPLLDECFPITIHVGEEDEDSVIQEAVFDLFTQRIGHGLSLIKRERLLKIVRERHIAIELCPISNFLTKDYRMKNDPDPQNTKVYPLREYLDENLDVTINADNPEVSDSTLSMEYLAASALTEYGLSKWEILRLIKNGFRSAAIPKHEKRLLMNAVDAELFQILTEEE